MASRDPMGGTAEAKVDSGLRIRMRSEERRIESQHERLDEFCREVYVRLDKEGPQSAINDFMLFAAALDAHLTVEEDIYFPALHGLRPDVGAELTELVVEHADLRDELDAVKQALKRNDAGRSIERLDHLARHISSHERREEDLISGITEGPVLAAAGNANP